MSDKHKCRSCDAEYTPAKKGRDFNFCRRRLCRLAQTTFLKENFELMGDCTFKTQYEDDFYSINDIQRAHFSTFFSLQRPKRNLKSKGRKCLRCRCSMETSSERNDHRICAECHRRNSKIGVSAEGW